MRYREVISEALRQSYAEPLIRIVGADFPDTFLHGTAKKNLKTLTAAERPDASKKPQGKGLAGLLIPPESNEFGAELHLAEPRQPQQAHLFSLGRGNTLVVVRLKPGTRILDLSDEVTRTASMTFGDEPRILRFFHRPAITDDLIAFQLNRISPGYKERFPDWRERVTASMDPGSPEFSVYTWQNTLVPYAKARGFAAIRFADEILLVDRDAIADIRLAKPKEKEAAATTRTYPPSQYASLYTDQPTGAHDEHAAYRRQD